MLQDTVTIYKTNHINFHKQKCHVVAILRINCTFKRVIFLQFLNWETWLNILLVGEKIKIK